MTMTVSLVGVHRPLYSSDLVELETVTLLVTTPLLSLNPLPPILRQTSMPQQNGEVEPLVVVVVVVEELRLVSHLCFILPFNYF